jgi:hypothetical protein
MEKTSESSKKKVDYWMNFAKNLTVIVASIFTICKISSLDDHFGKTAKVLTKKLDGIYINLSKMNKNLGGVKRTLYEELGEANKNLEGVKKTLDVKLGEANENLGGVKRTLYEELGEANKNLEEMNTNFTNISKKLEKPKTSPENEICFCESFNSPKNIPDSFVYGGYKDANKDNIIQSHELKELDKTIFDFSEKSAYFGSVWKNNKDEEVKVKIYNEKGKSISLPIKDIKDDCYVITDHYLDFQKNKEFFGEGTNKLKVEWLITNKTKTNKNECKNKGNYKDWKTLHEKTKYFEVIK